MATNEQRLGGSQGPGEDARRMGVVAMIWV